MESRTMLLLIAVLLTLNAVLFSINFFITPSKKGIEEITLAADLERAKGNAEFIRQTGGATVSEEEFEIALSLLELYEKCVSGPVECAISNAELVSPENIKKLKNVKVSMKDVGIFGQIMWYAEAWKAAAGEESFETCDARCREAFYMPFEVGDSGGSVSITATPFQITKVLYTNRDRIEATLCRGNLENCPAIKTCMEGYEIYEKEGESALRELIEKGVHDACFLVAKEFLMAREGKKVYPV